MSLKILWLCLAALLAPAAMYIILNQKLDFWSGLLLTIWILLLGAFLSETMR